MGLYFTTREFSLETDNRARDVRLLGGPVVWSHGLEEPGPSEGPVTLDGLFGGSQQRGNLGIGQPGEKAEFDDFCFDGVLSR